MISPPLVSVIIPVRNGAAFILESVRSALSQSYGHLECVVVDDGSVDGTAEILSSLSDRRLRVLGTGGRGSSGAARNIGCTEAAGQLLAFLDADDVWHPEKLQRQVTLFERQPGLAIAWCGYVITRSDLSPLTEIRPRRRHMDLQSCLLLEGNGIALTSTGIVSRTAYEEVHGFDEALSVSTDLDFAERVVRDRPAAALDDVLVAYRQHPEQIHRDLTAFESDMRQVLATRDLSPAAYRRGLANLSTRLFFYQLASHPRTAGRHLLQVGGRIDRLLMLPAAGITRKVARRIRRALKGITDPRRWYIAETSCHE